MRLAEKKQYLLLLALFQTSLLFNATSTPPKAGEEVAGIPITLTPTPTRPHFAPSTPAATAAAAAPATTAIALPVPLSPAVRTVTPPHQPIKPKVFTTPAGRLSSDGGGAAVSGEGSAFSSRTLSGGAAASSAAVAASREATGGAPAPTATRSLSSERKAQIAELEAFKDRLDARQRRREASAEKPAPSAEAAGGAGGPTLARKVSTEGTSATAEDYDVVSNWGKLFLTKAQEKIEAIFAQQKRRPSEEATTDSEAATIFSPQAELARVVIQQAFNSFTEVRGFLPHYTDITNLKAALHANASVTFQNHDKLGPIGKLLAIKETSSKALDDLTGILGELIAALAIELGTTGRMVVAFSQQRSRDLQMDIVVTSGPCTSVEVKNTNPRHLLDKLPQFQRQKTAALHLGFAYEVFSIAPLPKEIAEALTKEDIPYESLGIPEERKAAVQTPPSSPAEAFAQTRSSNLTKILDFTQKAFKACPAAGGGGGGGAHGTPTPRADRRRASTLTSPSSAAAAAAAASPPSTVSGEASPLRSPLSSRGGSGGGSSRKISRRLELSASSPRPAAAARSTDPVARIAELEEKNAVLINENNRLKLQLSILQAQLESMQGMEAAHGGAGRTPVMGPILEEELRASSTPSAAAPTATPSLMSPLPDQARAGSGAVKTMTPDEAETEETAEDAAEA